MSHAGSWILAMDTATNAIVIAAGTTAGELIAADAFEGRYRHSQELLPAITRLLAGAGLRLADLVGVIVGTGPGAFTGLRVGLATAKTLAHELGRPVVGIATSEALLAGVDGAQLLWLPAGPRDRVVVEPGKEPRVIRGDDPATESPTGASPTGGRVEVAVDLDGRAPDAALALGRRAIAALPATLLRLGAARIAADDVDDPERLVPRYASPPRGVPLEPPEEGVAWSRDPR